MVGWLLPAVQAAREAARRMRCSNNMKQLGLSLQSYHAAYNRFPGIGDGINNGWPVQAQILPFAEEAALQNIASVAVDENPLKQAQGIVPRVLEELKLASGQVATGRVAPNLRFRANVDGVLCSICGRSGPCRSTQCFCRWCIGDARASSCGGKSNVPVSSVLGSWPPARSPYRCWSSVCTTIFPVPVDAAVGLDQAVPAANVPVRQSRRQVPSPSESNFPFRY